MGDYKVISKSGYALILGVVFLIGIIFGAFGERLAVAELCDTNKHFGSYSRDYYCNEIGLELIGK